MNALGFHLQLEATRLLFAGYFKSTKIVVTIDRVAELTLVYVYPHHVEN